MFTMTSHGCCVVVLPLQDATGQVVGVHCRDKQSGRKFDVHAKVIINATGGCWQWCCMPLAAQDAFDAFLSACQPANCAGAPCILTVSQGTICVVAQHGVP